MNYPMTITDRIYDNPESMKSTITIEVIYDK